MNNTIYLPNTFQTPNMNVDALMRYLSGNEYKVLSCAVRLINGYQDKLKDGKAPIALSRFSEYTGISIPTIRTILNKLKKFKVLLAIGKPTPAGQVWQLGDRPDIDGLKSKTETMRDKTKPKMKKARESRQEIVPACKPFTQVIEVKMGSIGNNQGCKHFTPSYVNTLHASYVNGLQHKNPNINPNTKPKIKDTPPTVGDTPVDSSDSIDREKDWGEMLANIGSALQASGYDISDKSTKGLIYKIGYQFRDNNLYAPDVKPLMRLAYEAIKKKYKRPPLIAEYLWNSHYAEYKKSQTDTFSQPDDYSDPTFVRSKSLKFSPSRLSS